MSSSVLSLSLYFLPSLSIHFSPFSSFNISFLVSLLLKVAAVLASQEQKLYASAGAVAEEVLSSIRTVVAFGGEFKESARYSSEAVLHTDLTCLQTLTQIDFILD